MLSDDIKKSLGTYFSKLTSTVQLVCHQSSSHQQQELEELLEATAGCHERVEFVRSFTSSEFPYFELHRNNSPVGISFTGIPTGHEFSSLVLAILNCDHAGQLPDKTTIARMKALKGPAHLKTYISLSCTNCPLIVQALNLVVSFHPDLSHEMVDGSVAEAERDRLKVASVPSVYLGDQMIHAGRATLNELLETLEKHLGTKGEVMTAGEPEEFDVVVVGGGPSGISSAIYAARKGLKTAILAESLGGQLNETVGIENFISVIYTEGAQLAAQLAAHVREYPVEILEHRRLESITTDPKDPAKKSLVLSTGETVSAQRVIIATGARWRELGVPGEKYYLGKGVAYCPHCDGPYFKGKDVIVVGGGNSGVEAALDLSGIVKSVTVFEFQPQLKADKVLIDVLAARENAQIITSAGIEEIHGDGSQVTHVTYKDRHTQSVKEYPTSAVFVQIGLIPNSQFLQDTVETTAHGEIVIDDKNRTSAPGIYATGDVTTIPYKQIIISMGEGAKTALAAYEDSLLA